MTVSSETNKSGPYFGNGVTTLFDYEFKIVDKTHVKVVRTEGGADTALVVDIDYTVSGVGNDNGGQIETVVAPTSDQSITLLRNVPFVQGTDLENQGAYYAETVERALDLGVMRDQQLSERLNRTLEIPLSGGGPLILPAPDASKVIGWDDNGTGLKNYDNPTDAVATAVAAAATASAAAIAAAASEEEIAAGIGAIYLNVTPNTGVDVTAELNAALATMTRGSYILRPGEYLVSDTVQIADLNVINNSTKYNCELSAYGARIVSSVASGGVALRLNNVKNLTPRGLQIKSANKAAFSLDGVWTCRFVDIRAGNLPLNLGLENLDGNDNNLWLKFDNCEFNSTNYSTGEADDPTYANAIYYDACRIGGASLDGDTGPEYCISVYGSQGPYGVQYINCDVSYWTTGMLYVDEPVTGGAQIDFHGGYCDVGGVGTPIDTKGLLVNFHGGMVAHSSPKYLDTAILDMGSRQVLDLARGSRNGGRYPISGINLIKNGNLGYGDTFSYSGGIASHTLNTGVGLYGKYVNVTSTTANAYMNIPSVPLPFDGVYSLVAIIRNNGDALTGGFYYANGTAIRYNAIDIPANSGWVIASFSLEDAPLNAGDEVLLRLVNDNAANPNINFDVAYVGLTYGRTAPLLSQPPPDTNVWKVLAHDAAGWSHTGDTAETALVSVKLPGHAVGANGQVRVTTLWTYTNNANSKTLRVKHASTAGATGNGYTSLAVTTTALCRCQTDIHNRNSEASQIGGVSAGIGGWSATSLGAVTGTINTANDSYLNFTATCADAGDTIKLEAYTVEVLYQG